MTLYEQWLKVAYDEQGQTIKKFWQSFMPVETQIYKDLILTKDEEGKGHLSAPLEDFGKKYKLRFTRI